MRKLPFSLAWLFLASGKVTIFAGAVAPPVDSEDKNNQCTGLKIDFNRLETVTKNDMETITRSIFDVDTNENATMTNNTTAPKKSYEVNNVMPVHIQGTSQCLLQRHRLQETKQGVPIFGADIIVTVNDCTPPDQYAFGGGYNESPLAGVPIQAISDIDGVTFDNVDESHGYIPSKSREEATQTIADYYEIPLNKVGNLKLVLFPSTKGDFLSYTSEVMANTSTGIMLYDVIISAHTLEFLSICRKGTAHDKRIEKRRKLRRVQDDHRNLAVNCKSCAASGQGIQQIDWSLNETQCPIDSLYLNNTGRETTCVLGTLNEQLILGPGTVAKLHYGGTYDCMESDKKCYPNPLPLNCSDAISDVHYGVTQTLKFYQEYLGVMGGLRVSASDPVSVTSFVHYSKEYCNAFFASQTNDLYFGSCDCKLWSPLASMDIVGHELTHGITAYSSSLTYSYQSGGLNEAYSDIMGTTMEYYINDSVNKPDFLIGENLNGPILRDMENPPSDGKSIGNVCDYSSDLNVHYSSGVLNKAFVSTVRACEADGCSNERDCVLFLGPLFMYGNMHKLTQLSGFLISASTTCDIVDEFYMTRKPNTNCSTAQTIQFVKDGWNAVGVTLDQNCAGSTPNCNLSSTPGTSGNGGGNGSGSGGSSGGGGGVTLKNCFAFAFVRHAFQSSFTFVRSWFRN